MSKNIKSFKEGVLRTPLLPFEQLRTLNQKEIIEIASNKDFQDAISISSHDFYKKLIAWLEFGSKDEKDEKNIYITLYKYIARSASRPTPFGKFGSVSYISLINTVKDGQKLELDKQQKVHYKIDGRLLDKFINLIEDGKSSNTLTYYLNNTIYSTGDEFRYYEQKTNIEDVYYQLSKFENNELVSEILNVFQTGAKIKDIFPIGIKHDISKDDLFEFISELIAEKILISELRMTSNPSNIFSVLEKTEILATSLHQNDLNKTLKIINGLKKIVESLNKDENYATVIKTVSDVAKSLNIHHEIQDLVHVDTTRSCKNEIVVEQSLFDELIDSKSILQSIQRPITNPLAQFKEVFYKRYAYQAVSLMKVLDPEIGIGFPFENSSNENSPLIDNIKFPKAILEDKTISFTKAETMLLKKVVEFERKQLNEIDLTFDDVKEFKPIKGTNSFNAFFTLLDNSIQLNSFSGYSSTQLISRFAHLNDEIDDLCEKISLLENELNPEKILAEIIHVPELKSANLIQKRNYRLFEIPCLFKSSNDEVKSIPLSDIYLRITHDNNLELISKKYRKIIIPKLSNSLNYKRNSIPLYNFLCSMQSQNESSYIAFEWNNILNLFDHLPRVNFKRIVLTPELWKVSISEFSDIEPSYQEVCEWIIKRKINQQVYLARNVNDDNKLFIDFANPIALDVFFKELNKNKDMIIFESISNLCSKQVADSNGHFYNNEIILPCYKRQIITAPIYDFDRIFSKKVNTFLPGEEWFSFKIYAGYKTANELLTNHLYKKIENLIANNIVKKWFFVRYYDEGFHIRLRFLVENSKLIPLLYSQMLPTLKQFTSSNFIHNVVIDCYKRENERYNSIYIEEIESLFSNDSTFVIKYYNLLTTKCKTWEVAVLGINDLLENFGMDYELRKSLLQNLYDGFFNEFYGDKKLKKSLDKKYREIKIKLLLLLNSKGESLEQELQSLFSERSIKNKENIKGLFDVGFGEQLKKIHSGVISSLVHMFINKLFLSDNRRNELVIYYFLLQYYKSKCAILSQNKHLIDG